MTARGASLRLKLSGFIAALALIIVAVVSGTLITMRARDMRQHLVLKSQLYSQSLAMQLGPTVAFRDAQTAREVLNSLAPDPDVQRVALYDANDELIAGSPALPPVLRTPPLALQTVEGAQMIELAMPVLSREGPRGFLQLSVSTARFDAEIRRAEGATVAVAVVVLAFAVFAAWLIAGTVVRRLARLSAAADRVALGDLDQAALPAGAADEIGRLTGGFNAMLTRLKTLIAHVQDQAQREQERLTELVAARTAELADQYRELETSREQYRQIAESTSAVPFEYSLAEKRYRYVGPQAVSLLGYPIERWQQPQFLSTVMAADEYQRLVETTRDALASGARYEVEGEIPAFDRRMITVRFVAAATDGVVRGLMIDVTERKRLELELAQAQKLESIGRLASGVAHEINTPTQFVSDSVHFMRDAWADTAGLLHELRALVRTGGAADVMLETRAAQIDLDYLVETMPSAAERAIEGLGRIAAIVGSMKAFAHPEQDKVAVELNQALESTLIIAGAEYKYVADIERHFEPLPMLECWAGELNQVFLNLIVNAAHAIGEVVADSGTRGVISIASRCEDEQIVISIGDTGRGIPAAIREKVYDQFFTTKPVGKGTGQGLAIARKVVEKHHGSITFESTEGQGTIFTIKLPVGGATQPAASFGPGEHASMH